MTLSRCTVPLYCDPAFRPGVAALAEWLRDHHYSAHAADRILGHVAATGCLASAAYLDREDEAEASEVFIGALPAVELDAEAWDREDVFLDAGLLADGRHPWPIPAVGDDDREFDAAMDALEDLPLPISGGAPEPEPSPEDLADYARWSEDLDRRRDGEPARTDRYSARSLEAIHRALYGRSEPFHA
jgi:hypothetical protein